LGQAGNGGNQHRAEHEAYDADDRKNGTLEPGQALAFWVIKKVRKLFVDLDHWQEPGKTGAEAPDECVWFRLRFKHSFHPRFEINRAEERE
jgi:hypothetical protein